jgi:hypothetical protein
MLVMGVEIAIVTTQEKLHTSNSSFVISPQPKGLLMAITLAFVLRQTLSN